MKPSWVPITELTVGDLVCVPPLLSSRRAVRHARLYGYYVAEGCATPRSVRLNFGPRDGAWVEDVRTLFPESRTYEYDGNKVLVDIPDRMWAKAFPDWFGTDATVKRIPPFLLCADQNSTADLLCGMWRGDGCRTTRNGFEVWTYSTASRTLAIQTVQLLSKLGIRSSLNAFPQAAGSKAPGNSMHQIIVSADAEKMAGVMGSRPRGRVRKSRWSMGHITPWGTLFPIREKAVGSYRGPVYNLHVATDESYIVNGFAVHNCFGLVVAETLACGTPVITTNFGAMPELVRDGRTGFVCDSMEQLARAVGDVDLLRPEDCARDARERFDRRVMAKNYEVEYRRVMDAETWGL